MVTPVESALQIVFVGTGSAILILVFAIARYMSTGIFRRFFLYLKLTAIIIFIGRMHVALIEYGLVPTPLTTLQIDYAYRIAWSILLMLSLVFLYVDWKMTSLDQAIKPR